MSAIHAALWAKDECTRNKNEFNINSNKKLMEEFHFK